MYDDYLNDELDSYNEKSRRLMSTGTGKISTSRVVVYIQRRKWSRSWQTTKKYVGVRKQR